jgi:3-oxoacyl-[acyl-carrier protein] reductase
MNRLDGKLALVTGASRGIGQAIALELAAQGATVAGTATSEAGADQISRLLGENGFRGRGFVLNVNDGPQMETVVHAACAEFGPLYALINNAGITRDNLLLRMKDSEWDDIMETNLKAVFRFCRLSVRHLVKARAGRIINIVSVSGEMGNAGQTNYAAAKAGMVGFSKSLAREVGSRNITVNCVAPGFIETDMTRALAAEQVKKLVESVPLGRLGRVDDVAQAVLFLCSPAAAYITGATLHVNGGMHME